MLLNLNDDQFLENPGEGAVRSAIAGLGSDEFAVLSCRNEEYLQTYCHADGTYDVEYRDGSYEKHYAAAGDGVVVGDIEDAFVAYVAGREDWKGLWGWERVEFEIDFEGDVE